MIQLDVNAGTHFDGKEIGVSRHAVDEAVADFRIPELEAREWIREQLRKAQFIGTMFGENGVQVRLFGFQRIAFIVALDADVVITIYPRHKVDQTLRTPIEKIVRDAVQASSSRVQAIEESASKVIAGFEAGKIRAEVMLQAATDDTVKQAMFDWIADLKKMIAEESAAIDEARLDHARLLKGVVAYV